jgi:hypothetical protein
MPPRSWLAVLRNYSPDRKLSAALERIYPPALDTGAHMPGKDTPLSFYYGQEEPPRLEYPFRSRLAWDGFLGALSTASSAPEYTGFERAARRIFDRFSLGGVIEQQGLTELHLGRMGETW